MKKYDWSESDINFLLVNIDKIPLKLISKELGKPYHCVLSKKKKLFSNTDNSDYWHRDTKNADDLRYGFLKNLGYKILVINECEYKKTPDKVLENCLKFIND
jgi:hypothetical protein